MSGYGKIGRGILVAQVRDPDTGQALQLDRHEWASMGDFEAAIADDFVGPSDVLQSGPNTINKGARPRLTGSAFEGRTAGPPPSWTSVPSILTDIAADKST